MLNNHLTSLKSNPYSKHDSMADISVSSVAMLFEQEENCFKENFVKYQDWKILRFSRFLLFYGKMIGVIVKGKSVAIRQMFLVMFIKILERLVWILRHKLCKLMVQFLAYRRQLSFGSHKPAVNLGLIGSVDKRTLAFTR